MIDMCFNVENKAFCSLLNSLGLCGLSDDSFIVIGESHVRIHLLKHPTPGHVYPVTLTSVHFAK